MRPSILCRTAILCLLVSGISRSGSAQDHAAGLLEAQSWSGSYLAGFTWPGDNQRRDVFTAEYASRWRFGDTFFFLDVANLVFARGGGSSTSASTRGLVYGEWHPRISVFRLFGFGRAGPLADLQLASELNFGGGSLAHLHGVGTRWALPRAWILRTNLYVRNDLALPGMTWQILVAWAGRIHLASVMLFLTGFADVLGPEGDARGSVVTAPQILVDVGAAIGHPHELYLGTELHYKAGYGQPDVFVPQVMAKWFF